MGWLFRSPQFEITEGIPDLLRNLILDNNVKLFEMAFKYEAPRMTEELAVPSIVANPG
jgi:hypothetical protein